MYVGGSGRDTGVSFSCSHLRLIIPCSVCTAINSDGRIKCVFSITQFEWDWISLEVRDIVLVSVSEIEAIG